MTKIDLIRKYWQRISLGFWFLFIPSLLLSLGFILKLWIAHLNPWYIMAYGIQIGAFIIFIYRVKRIYKFNHPRGYSIWESIKANFFNKTFEIDISNQFTLKPKYSGESLTDKGILSQEILTNRLRLLEAKVRELPDQTDEKINKIKYEIEEQIEDLKKANDQEKRIKSNFAMYNTGPEFVAVSWLLIAAFIFLISHIHV